MLRVVPYTYRNVRRNMSALDLDLKRKVEVKGVNWFDLDMVASVLDLHAIARERERVREKAIDMEVEEDGDVEDDVASYSEGERGG